MATPERMCVGCRNMYSKASLIRLVKDKATGKAVLDEKQKILARGIYVCNNSKCIRLAKKKKAFERFFRNGAYDELYDSLIEKTEGAEE